jgi:uncharacterized protein (TIGR02246 family)
MSDNTGTLEARIKALEDIEAIRNLTARYGFVIDDRDIEAVGDCFTQDGRFRSVDGRMDARGREAVVDQFHARFAALTTGNHIAHQQVVELDPDDPDRATGLLSSHAEVVRLGKTMLSALRYRDEFRRCADGKWRFADRELSFFYYLEPADYPALLGTELRNHAYEEPLPADVPEGTESWKRYAGEHLGAAEGIG